MADSRWDAMTPPSLLPEEDVTYGHWHTRRFIYCPECRDSWNLAGPYYCPKCGVRPILEEALCRKVYAREKILFFFKKFLRYEFKNAKQDKADRLNALKPDRSYGF